MYICKCIYLCIYTHIQVDLLVKCRKPFVYTCTYVYICIHIVIYIYRQDLLVKCHKLVTQQFPCAMHMCTMAYSYVYHVCHGSFIYVPWLIYMCSMTQCCTSPPLRHSYVYHDSFICVQWLNVAHHSLCAIHMCAMTYIYIQVGPACKVPQTSYTTPALRHAYVYHGLFICVPCVPWLIHMGWLWLVGSLKSLVSFAEYGLFYRALLQKRPIILRSLLIVATPYVYHDSFICV